MVLPLLNIEGTTVVFTMLATLNIIINLDGGGVPAALINIQQTFGLTATQLHVTQSRRAHVAVSCHQAHKCCFKT